MVKRGIVYYRKHKHALNILRKSSAVSCNVIAGLCSRGEVDTPVRVKIV